MRETLKRIKADIILSAVLCTGLGIMILVWPGEVIGVLCKALAVVLMVIGAVNLATFFRNRQRNAFSGVLGAIVVLVGLWIFFKPESVVSLIPIVIGVILMVHGIQDLKVAFEVKANGYGRWWSMMIIAAVSLVLGIVCVINAFGMVKLAMQFIGVALIYDGLSDLWVATKAVRTAKAMKAESDALESEYKEVDD